MPTKWRYWEVGGNSNSVPNEHSSGKICPYAYAYVFWKDSLYNINPFVDEGRTFSQKKIYQFDLPFHIFEDSFKELLMVFNHSDYRIMK